MNDVNLSINQSTSAKRTLMYHTLERLLNPFYHPGFHPVRTPKQIADCRDHLEEQRRFFENLGLQNLISSLSRDFTICL